MRGNKRGRKTLSSVSGAIIIALASAQLARAQAYDPCKTQKDTVEMNDCTKIEFAASEKELNQVYRALLDALPKTASDYNANAAEVRKLLVEAQRAWVLFRKKDCDGVAELNAGGTMSTMIFFRCMQARGEQRSKELQEWVK